MMEGGKDDDAQFLKSEWSFKKAEASLSKPVTQEKVPAKNSISRLTLRRHTISNSVIANPSTLERSFSSSIDSFYENKENNFDTKFSSTNLSLSSLGRFVIIVFQLCVRYVFIICCWFKCSINFTFLSTMFFFFFSIMRHCLVLLAKRRKQIKGCLEVSTNTNKVEIKLA